MSQLAGFMDGLNKGREQVDRDTRLQMDMEQRRSALQNDAMANARADERLGMDRDRAMRETRDSDFQHTQRQGAADRDAKVREGLANAFRTHLGERDEPQPDGTVKRVKPDPADLKVQSGLFADVIRVRMESGSMDPNELKQLYTYKQQIEKDGSMQAFRQLLAGDGSGVAAQLKGYGLDPKSVRMQASRDPKTGMTSTRLVGQGPQGPFEMDMTPVMLALGLPDVDLDKAGNERALTGARIGQAQDTGRAALMRGQADMVEANAKATAIKERGAGGDFSSKDVVNEKNRAFDDIKGGVAPNSRFGYTPERAANDPFKQKFVRGLADTMIDKSVEQGRLIAGPSARIEAEKRFDEIEELALDRLEASPDWKKIRMNPSKAFQARNEMFDIVRRERAQAKAAAKKAEGRPQAIKRD
jgi:hypothetical protein